MWLWDILEDHIKFSSITDDRKMHIVLNVPSEKDILKFVGDGKGKPTKKSDQMLLKRIREFGDNGNFMLLFDLGLSCDTDEEMDFAEKVESAIYEAERGELLGQWESTLEGRELVIKWHLPDWIKKSDFEIHDSQPLTDVIGDWYINDVA